MMDLSMATGDNYRQVETYDFEDTESDFSDDSMEDLQSSFAVASEDTNGTKDTESTTEKCKDIPAQLLGFADRLTKDIKKCFHDPRGSIYDVADEDQTTKSGRELYYVELLKLARGYDADSVQKTRHHVRENVTTTTAAPGGNGVRLGNDLGPLGDLFNPAGVSAGLGQTVPMEGRKLPRSFWREPPARADGMSNDVDGDVREAFGLQEDHTVFVGTDVKDLLSMW
jgi:hypothetical protein